LTAAAAPSPAARSRFSLESLQQSRPAKAVAGVLLCAGVAVIVWLIIEAFTGQFTNIVKIRAELPPGSNAVGVTAPVEYLNVTVGKIGAESEAPDGNVQVEIEIYPKNLPNIPAGVQAQVVPLSIFGNQYVNLVPPAQIGAGHLVTTDFVSPYQGAPSASLQATVTQLYGLLNAVHPADLDTALTAFAQALNNEGTALGQTLTGSDNYLGKAVVPNLSNVSSDFNLLTPVNNEINRASPSILGTLANSSVTARTITEREQEQALQTLLTNGTSAIGQFGGVLQQVKTQLPTLMNESGPLLADVTQSPTELSRTLSGLTTFASAVAAQEQAGPFLSVTVKLPVANISAGVNAALGYNNPASVDQALGSAINPPTYTSANCPQYPGETNPYCGRGGSPAAAPTGGTVGMVRPLGAPAPASSGSVSAASSSPALDLASIAASDPNQAEIAATQEVATALDGGTPPAQPALATFVLMPLLMSITGN
jgi:phospholipid/cholesterol/gamma-HCH transport system substrate-binding protein